MKGISLRDFLNFALSHLKLRNMKPFIKLTSRDSETVLINVNNVVRIQKGELQGKMSTIFMSDGKSIEVNDSISEISKALIILGAY